jgi:hypothetical protein
MKKKRKKVSIELKDWFDRVGLERERETRGNMMGPIDEDIYTPS